MINSVIEGCNKGYFIVQGTHVAFLANAVKGVGERWLKGFPCRSTEVWNSFELCLHSFK